MDLFWSSCEEIWNLLPGAMTSMLWPLWPLMAMLALCDGQLSTQDEIEVFAQPRQCGTCSRSCWVSSQHLMYEEKNLWWQSICLLPCQMYIVHVLVLTIKDWGLIKHTVSQWNRCGKKHIESHFPTWLCASSAMSLWKQQPRSLLVGTKQRNPGNRDECRFDISPSGWGSRKPMNSLCEEGSGQTAWGHAHLCSSNQWDKTVQNPASRQLVCFQCFTV